MKYRVLNRIGLLLILVPLLALGMHYAHELAMVDQCLDAGGAFDYTTMSCSFTERSEYIPYSQRYRWSLNIALGISFLGLVINMLGRKRSRFSSLGGARTSRVSGPIRLD
ncbi:MAG: hypothetical protein ACE5NW_07735 [Acidiferrobacterales bacterium]